MVEEEEKKVCCFVVNDDDNDDDDERGGRRKMFCRYTVGKNAVVADSRLLLPLHCE